jgi:hypothetical protein
MRTRNVLHALSIVCAGIAALPNASSAEFSWQLAGDGRRQEVGDLLEVDGAAVSATYFFRPVDEEVGPYALAAFLNRSSRLGVSVHSDEERRSATFSLFGVPRTVTSADAMDGYSASGRYVWRDSGWYAGGGIADAHGDPPASTCFERDRELRGASVHAGKYLGRATSIELSAATTEMTEEIVLLCPLFSPFSSPVLFGPDLQSNEATLSVLHVGALGGLTYAITGEASSSRADLSFVPASYGPPTPTSLPPAGLVIVGGGVAAPPVGSFAQLLRDRFQTYSAGAELFPTMRLGIRLGYSRWDEDPVRDEGYELATTWFFQRNIAARFAFARTTQNVFDPSLRDADSVVLQLIGRF